jgi:hypothetical protein
VYQDTNCYSDSIRFVAEAGVVSRRGRAKKRYLAIQVLSKVNHQSAP